MPQQLAATAETNRHYVIVGARQRDRAQAAADLRLPPRLLPQLSAHRNLRGPYTAAGTLMRALVPEALRNHAALIRAHEVELLTVAPELRDLLPATQETLTSLAIPSERTRFYSRLRTLRIAHGLTEFLRDYLAFTQRGPVSLVAEDLHQADPTDQEFFAVLLRRISPTQLLITVGVSDELLALPAESNSRDEARPPAAGGLPLAVKQHCQLVPAAACGTVNPPRSQDPAATRTLARRYVADECISDEPALRTAYDTLPPAERTLMHDQRADELVALGERSLALGAIPFHREHGSDSAGSGASALRDALDYCIDMGFYHATIDLGTRGRAAVDWQRQPALWWVFTTKMTTSLAAIGRPGEAEKLYDEARAHTTSGQLHMQAAYATAMLYTRHYPPERRDHERALSWINESIAIASLLPDPRERAFNTVFHRNGLALIEVHRGRPQQALDLVTEGLALLDKELGADEHQLHRSVLGYNRAQVLAGLGRLEESLADYRLVCEADPHYPEYHFDIANLLRRLGHDGEALAEYETTMRLGPPFPEPYFNRADIRVSRGEAEAALADYGYVLELDPGFTDAYLNRAAIYADLGDLVAAQADVQRGLALEPEHPQLLGLCGRLALEQGELDAADASLSAALAADPNLPETWALRGAVYYESGNLTAALADLSQAVQLSPDPTVVFNRGTVHQKLGNWAEAIVDYSRVLDTDPEEPDSLLHRSQCRLAAGDREGAEADIARFRQAAPDRTAEARELLMIAGAVL
jgi:tetratricopeptide (TPR) repeat protein